MRGKDRRPRAACWKARVDPEFLRGAVRNAPQPKRTNASALSAPGSQHRRGMPPHGKCYYDRRANSADDRAADPAMHPLLLNQTNPSVL